MRALHLTLSFALSLAACAVAHAQIAGDKVKIGVLTDLSGAYEAASGAGSVEGARMAAEEFGWKVNGKPIEILAGDHQNKPDLGAAIANRWFDIDKVDAIADLVNSSVAFRGARHRQTEEQNPAADLGWLGRFYRQGLRAG